MKRNGRQVMELLRLGDIISYIKDLIGTRA